MKDIADRAGVSTVTVSKALSGQRGVSEQVRAHDGNYLGLSGKRRCRPYRYRYSQTEI